MVRPSMIVLALLVTGWAAPAVAQADLFEEVESALPSEDARAPGGDGDADLFEEAENAIEFAEDEGSTIDGDTPTDDLFDEADAPMDFAEDEGSQSDTTDGAAPDGDLFDAADAPSGDVSDADAPIYFAEGEGSDIDVTDGARPDPFDGPVTIEGVTFASAAEAQAGLACAAGLGCADAWTSRDLQQVLGLTRQRARDLYGRLYGVDLSDTRYTLETVPPGVADLLDGGHELAPCTGINSSLHLWPDFMGQASRKVAACTVMANGEVSGCGMPAATFFCRTLGRDRVAACYGVGTAGRAMHAGGMCADCAAFRFVVCESTR